MQVGQIHSCGVTIPPERSPLIDAHVKAVVLDHRTDADLGSNLQALVKAYRNVLFSVYI